jgi:hypothetical protein
VRHQSITLTVMSLLQDCLILDGSKFDKGVCLVHLNERDIMRITNSQLRLISKSTEPSTQLTDTSGNPSESYHWSHMAAVRREWQYEFWRPCVNAFELTLSEVMSIERHVRKELYP